MSIVDKFFSEEVEYIQERIDMNARNSPIKMVRCNYKQAQEILSDLYIICNKRHNKEPFEDEKELKGFIILSIVNLLKKTGSSFVRGLNKSSQIEVDVDSYEVLSIPEEESETEDDTLISEGQEYAIALWNLKATPSDKLLLKYYFEGYDSIRALAEYLGVTHYSADLLMYRMKNVLRGIVEGEGTFEELNEKYRRRY